MFTLESVVPWGRSFDEYRRMFALGDADLGARIVGCGDGPAAFNAEVTRRGGRVVSCDPLYQFERRQIEERIAATSGEILDQARRNAHEFVWGDGIGSVEELGQRRMAAMRVFLGDYDVGRTQARYVPGALPALPFADGTFDLALCSHFLFLYSAQLGEAFHRAAVLEMCRVASQVRIFPLVALGGETSPFATLCAQELSRAGYDVAIETVPYEFQRGANQMMRIRRPGSTGRAGGVTRRSP